MKHMTAVVTVGLVLTAGCATPLTTREKGALTGAAIGAGTGAILGKGKGAAIGGAIGGLSGAVVGDQLQKREQVAAEQQRQLDEQRQQLARNRKLIEELKRRNLEARETARGVVVNLPDVLFEFGRANLTREARGRVREIADVLLDQARGRRVAVEGHTDSVGSEEYNLRLSRQRAQRVAEGLTAEGVPQRRIVVRGFGERYPVAPNTFPDGRDNPEGRARNRRVEVVIEN